MTILKICLSWNLSSVIDHRTYYVLLKFLRQYSMFPSIEITRNHLAATQNTCPAYDVISWCRSNRSSILDWLSKRTKKKINKQIARGSEAPNPGMRKYDPPRTEKWNTLIRFQRKARIAHSVWRRWLMFPQQSYSTRMDAGATDELLRRNFSRWSRPSPSFGPVVANLNDHAQRRSAKPVIMVVWFFDSSWNK